MPARVSARTSATSRVSRKSSVPTLNASTASRLSPDDTEVQEESPTSALRANICAIFGDAQRTTAGHRKLVVNLRKIQETCCYESETQGKRALDGYDEEDFNAEVGRCVVRVLPVKKSEGAGDRIVRFLGQFLRHASEKGV